MYIVLEGVKGSGKSTQLQLLQQWIAKHQWSVQYLHPTKAMPEDIWWEQARAWFADNDDFLAQLYAARANHHAQQVDFNRSDWVIGDRSVLTSFVTRLPKNEAERWAYLNKIMKMEYNMRIPEHVIYLQSGSDLLHIRTRLQQRQRDYGLSDESLQRLQDACAGYEYLQHCPHPLLQHTQWYVIDALQSADAVHRDIVSVLLNIQEQLASTH